MFLQGSLLVSDIVGIDHSVAVERHHLDATTWVDVARGWLGGPDDVYAGLASSLPWRQRRGVPMYDRLVDEPRLSHWWRSGGGETEPLPVLAEVREYLIGRYGRPFDSIGFNLYRDGDDSVAWHADRHRHHVVDPVVAIVSVGTPRPLRLRPNGGGRSRAWHLGSGDLFVMGGACQHRWQHTVPKVRSAAPRLSITFRHGVA